MDGEWISVARIRAGVQQISAPSHAVIENGKFNTVRDGKVQELGKISEAVDVSPHQYNILMEGDVPDSGKSFHGIFSISGDTMFTCVNPEAESGRPGEFLSTRENGNILIVWVRKQTLERVQAVSAGAKEQ
jgi:uncharacterized protein (TIGR03067 family)